MRKNNFYNSYNIFFPCILLPLFGFTDFVFKDDVIDDVRSGIEQVRSTSKPSISLDGDMNAEAVSPYSPYKFKAVNENPFAVKNFVGRVGVDMVDKAEDICQDEDCGDGPPTPHAKYFLENYNLDQLAMIGSMFDKQRGKVALIQTPDVGVIYTSPGEYIGRNNGLILSIDSDQMLIREKYRSPKGWQDRMAKLPLLKK